MMPMETGLQKNVKLQITPYTLESEKLFIINEIKKMDLSKILSINGKAGLFKLISKGKNNFIVESLIDRKRFPAFSHEGVSSLDNIAIFTYENDVPLADVFKIIYTKENGGKTPDISKDANQLKEYFEEILPNYDKEKVYTHSMKKTIVWYNLLHDEGLLDFTEEAEKTSGTEGAEETSGTEETSGAEETEETKEEL